MTMRRWPSASAILVGLFFLGLLLFLGWSSDRDELAVRDTALARLDEGVTVSGTLVNRGGQGFSRLAIEVAFFDPDHRKIGSASAVVAKLEPRGEVRFSTKPASLPKAAHYQVALPAARNPYGN